MIILTQYNDDSSNYVLKSLQLTMRVTSAEEPPSSHTNRVLVSLIETFGREAIRVEVIDIGDCSILI